MLRKNPDLVINAVRECDCPGAEIMGQYAVLGKYDFVMLAEANDNTQQSSEAHRPSPPGRSFNRSPRSSDPDFERKQSTVGYVLQRYACSVGMSTPFLDIFDFKCMTRGHILDASINKTRISASALRRTQYGGPFRVNPWFATESEAVPSF